MNKNQTDQTEFHLPIWMKSLGITPQEFVEFSKLSEDQISSNDEVLRVIYEGVKKFSRKYQKDFYTCCMQAIDLCQRQTITQEEVIERLCSTAKSLSLPDNTDRSIDTDYKTIMFVGQSGGGKSTLANQIIGKDLAAVGKSKSATKGAELYVSHKYRLNIIDTEGIDGTDQKKLNVELMTSIVNKTIINLEHDAAIDAIIVVWCPIKSGRSQLVKTIETLKSVLGEAIVKSCIVMIQGNWRKLMELVDDIEETVEEGKAEVQNKFPNIPFIEYDAKDDPYPQRNIIKRAISRVKPCAQDLFEQIQKDRYFETYKAYLFKTQQIKRKARQEIYEEREKLFPNIKKGASEDFTLEETQAIKERLKIFNEEAKQRLLDARKERGDAINNEKLNLGDFAGAQAKAGLIGIGVGSTATVGALTIGSVELLVAGSAVAVTGVAFVGSAVVLGTGYGIYKGLKHLLE